MGIFRARQAAMQIPVPLVTVGLLTLSNIFMTFAWYGHLRYKGAASQPGKELYGIEVTNDGLVIFGGGELLIKDGVIVGAIGVSGGSVAEDTNVAKAGAAAFDSTAGKSK